MTTAKGRISFSQHVCLYTLLFKMIAHAKSPFAAHITNPLRGLPYVPSAGAER
jgi:hypothetical protein